MKTQKMLWLVLLIVSFVSMQPANPRVFTIVVYHEECTECGDLEIESGEVIVPVELREKYIEASIKSPALRRLSDRRERVIKRCDATGYTVGNVRLESEAAFDSLFLVSGRKRDDVTANPWDFNRRYRVTGVVTGLKGSYLTFRIRKATLLKKAVQR